MSDCIEGVQEAVDGEFGAALTARSAELSRGPVGLGPPDLCYLHKSYRSALGLGGLKLLGGTVQLAQDQAAVGFYHHVIGLDALLVNRAMAGRVIFGGGQAQGRAIFQWQDALN